MMSVLEKLLGREQSATNPPDSPPAGPVVPEGLTTKYGKFIMWLCGIVAGVAAIMPGDHGEVWKWAVAIATVVYGSLTASRGYQAGKISEAAPLLAMKTQAASAGLQAGSSPESPPDDTATGIEPDEDAQGELEATDGLPSEDDEFDVTTASDEPGEL